MTHEWEQPNEQPSRRRSHHAITEMLASHVRDMYIMERRAWTEARTGITDEYMPGPFWDGGKKQRDGTMTKPVWPGIALFLIENDIGNYATFVHAQFAARNRKGHPPTPLQLKGNVAIQNWKKYAHGPEEHIKMIQRAFERQKQVARANIARETQNTPNLSRVEIQEYVLLSETLELTALFRYCLAISEKLVDVARRYHQAALVQYVLDRRSYDQIWQDWIPAGLAKAADNLSLAIY